MNLNIFHKMITVHEVPSSGVTDCKRMDGWTYYISEKMVPLHQIFPASQEKQRVTQILYSKFTLLLQFLRMSQSNLHVAHVKSNKMFDFTLFNQHVVGIYKVTKKCLCSTRLCICVYLCFTSCSLPGAAPAVLSHGACGGTTCLWLSAGGSDRHSFHCGGT